MRSGIKFLLENSLFLILGAVAGLLWANLDHQGYEALLHFPILHNDWIGVLHEGHRVVNLHYLVNDFLMALFFAIAGKEVWEAFLPGGPLSEPKKAATPLMATLGGVIVPALIYLGGAGFIGRLPELATGWAVPCATDIAFSYMVARFIFGAGHAAIPFLLLLAIADDAIGLVIIAVAYPQEELRLVWLLLVVTGILACVFIRRLRIHSFWPYLLVGGTLSWLGFALSGLHPALGLLPIIPVIPHAHVDRGLFDWSRIEEDDTLTRFEHWWKNPVELILGAFGLLNAGVVVSSVGAATWLVLAGLLIGKPLGIWGFGMIAAKGLRFGMPPGLRTRDLVVIGFAAAIGFTVALFVATVAFPAGAAQDAAKMGALGSFLAAGVTWLAARIVGVTKVEAPDSRS
ncbi:MAG: Na+/H+ antiporter NhaA [Acidobacteriota bacterium]|nr:Na+/H+ antiporter NhaA [Acidobacteriota bacterium]MDH3521994.1 Na+/H+ antiporter NhaA [Acidobacteriota bacterium]